MDKKHLAAILMAAALLGGCATGVQVTHSPIVATSGEQITFTAKSFETSPPANSRKIQILVNASVVKECNSSPCSYTGGPYPAGYLHYAANVTSQGEFLGLPLNATFVDGYYHTEITGPAYASSNQVIRGRVRSTASSTDDNADIVFHMADDYAEADEDLSDFIGDATDKVQDILGSQDILEEELNHLNFWVYKREAQIADCGTVHHLAAYEISFSDVEAVLHTTSVRDCNSGTHFSAEGSNTQAFLHETSHALINLGDEYDGDTCYGCVGSPEANIFPTEAECQAEQTNKGRDPAACYEFTAERGGWWGIHGSGTVMAGGLRGQPWGIEAEERVNWFFDGY